MSEQETLDAIKYLMTIQDKLEILSKQISTDGNKNILQILADNHPIFAGNDLQSFLDVFNYPLRDNSLWDSVNNAENKGLI